jgi:hypothetical protein
MVHARARQPCLLFNLASTARGGYVATRRALAPSHYTIPPTIASLTIASLTIQHSDTLSTEPLML